MTRPRAKSNVVEMSAYRLVWMLPHCGGVHVSIIARGFPVRSSRERWFALDQYQAAIDYADQLSADSGSAVVDCMVGAWSGKGAEDA